MKAAVLVTLAALALALAMPAGGSTTRAAVTPARAAKLGAQAYRYGFPLLEFLRVRRTETGGRCPDHKGDAPVNSFSHATGFARPSDRAVVAPNVDTLYSIAHLDLGRGPVVLTHPAMGRRYLALSRNPPPARDRPLLRTLATVGVGPGRRPERAGLSNDVLRGLVTGVDQAAASLPDDAKLTVLAAAKHNHGWAVPSPQTGNYATNYAYRAEIASVGLGANTPREAMYPVALTDVDGQLLNGSSSYRIVFRRGQVPPERAFWSLTMYGSSGYLVPNPAHRYAIGSSHPPLRHRADGDIVVIVSRRHPTEPAVNWLPPPAGRFRLNLRIYRPKASALDGRWQPPPVEPIATG